MNKPPLSAHYFREFLGVSVLVSIVTLFISFWSPITAINNVMYDYAIRYTHARPASADIVIITIDDQSLEQLGTWPWRRVLHAQLLRHLHQAKAVGYDITFLGPSYHPEDDLEFARAIQSHGRVVLASFFNEMHGSNLPVLPLAEASNQMGFINVPLDSDGIVRRINRFYEGEIDTQYHLALSMLLAGGYDPIQIENKVLSNTPLIPYSGAPSYYATVSYADVLNLRVPSDLFKDKYVLIGAWATGLGDKSPTPTSTESINMSGVEIIANVIQAELENRWIEKASPRTVLWVSLLWVIAYCALVVILSPRAILLATLALFSIVFLSHFWILKYFDTWIRLDASLVSLLLVYPLWNWRLQELVLKQMRREIEALNQERSLLSMEHIDDKSSCPDQHRLNTFEDNIYRLRSALARVRNLRQFIYDSLNSMPYASAVFDHQNQLLFSTEITNKYFKKLNEDIAPQMPLIQFIYSITGDANLTAEIASKIAQWSSHATTDSQQYTFSQQQLDFQDKLQQDMLLTFAPTYTSRGDISGFILTFIDLSRIRAEERQREQTIHFLTHDMRAPQSAIQALIKMQQNPETELSKEAFLQQVNHLSKTTLTLLDNFLFLARAKNATYDLTALNLYDLLQNTIDNFWSMAKARQIQINITNDAQTMAYVLADGTLLSRAFNNLIDNAIKYGKDGMKITINIQEDNGYWRVDIADQGIGIPETEFARIFHIFSRAPQIETKRVSGLGLGLAFVHTVVVGHKGIISLDSEEGVGTTFHIKLPILPDEESV